MMVGSLATAFPGALLLGLWERAGPLGPVDRALMLASAAGGDPEQLAARPVGLTYLRVLDLRERMLGPQLTATAGCPACADVVEFDLDVRELRTAADGVRGDADASELGAQRQVEVDARDGRVTLTWRPPTPTDLVEVARAADPAAELTRRCVRVTTGAPGTVDPVTLDLRVLADIEQAMAAADPLAEVVVAVTCPACDTTFPADVDLAAFVWAEVEAGARKVLDDVDLLARTYGWSEPDVLALSETRRAAYVGLASGVTS